MIKHRTNSCALLTAVTQVREPALTHSRARFFIQAFPMNKPTEWDIVAETFDELALAVAASHDLSKAQKNTVLNRIAKRKAIEVKRARERVKAKRRALAN